MNTMKPQLGLSVLYRDVDGNDWAGVIVRICKSNQAEIWVYPVMGRGGRTAVPISYSAEPKPNTWRLPAMTRADVIAIAEAIAPGWGGEVVRSLYWTRPRGDRE